MKKIVCLSIVLFALLSCTSYEVKDSSVSTKIVEVSVGQSDWSYTNYTTREGSPFANNYFFCLCSIPSLTSDIFNKGKVEAYVVYNKGMSGAFQHVLPYSRHYEEQKSDSTWNYYTETVDCVYGIGWIEFNFRSSDFIYEEDPTVIPNAMDFRVVMSR